MSHLLQIPHKYPEPGSGLENVRKSLGFDPQKFNLNADQPQQQAEPPKCKRGGRPRKSLKPMEVKIEKVTDVGDALKQRHAQWSLAANPFRNEEYITPESIENFQAVNTRSYDAPLPNGTVEERIATLTAKQFEVFKLLAEGVTNNGIARQCGVSMKAIEMHRLKLYRKLDVHCAIHLAHLALRYGIIENRYAKEKQKAA